MYGCKIFLYAILFDWLLLVAEIIVAGDKVKVREEAICGMVGHTSYG